MSLDVKLKGVRDFDAALADAVEEMTPELDAKLYQGARQIRDRAAVLAPRKSGELADGYKVIGSNGNYIITNDAPHAPGAEFGRHGKWKGFRKYGPRAKRFIFRAKDTVKEGIARNVQQGIRRIMRARGWLS